MDAAPLRLAPVLNSALRPTGPVATEMFPPIVRLPICENVQTARASFRMKTKSVSSTPMSPPNPTPPVTMAEGADQLPLSSRAIITPDPNRMDPRNPALVAVKIMRPYRSSITTLSW